MLDDASQPAGRRVTIAHNSDKGIGNSLPSRKEPVNGIGQPGPSNHHLEDFAEGGLGALLLLAAVGVMVEGRGQIVPAGDRDLDQFVRRPKSAVDSFAREWIGVARGISNEGGGVRRDYDGDVMMADAGGGSQRTSYFASVLLRERGIVWSGMAQRKYTRSFS